MEFSHQEILSNLFSILLIVPGLVLTVAGLMYWLGGLKWLGFPAVFTASIAGFVPAWFLYRDNLYVMVLAPVVCATFGMFLKRTTVALLGITLTAVLTVAVFVGPKIANAQYWSDRPVMAENENTDNIMYEYMEYLQEWAGYLIEKIQIIVQEIPSNVRVLAVIVFVSGLILVVLKSRWIAAFTCSVLGTVSIGLGLALLVTFKGLKPFADFSARPGFYILIACATSPLGTGIQLALCPEKKKKKKDKLEETSEELKEGKKS